VKGLLNKKRTSNIERPTSNVEWEKKKKQTYDLEERLLDYSVSIIKNDILEETEELIKIFVTSIKTAVRQAHGPERSRRAEKKQK
jgi:hypothetical protein